MWAGRLGTWGVVGRVTEELPGVKRSRGRDFNPGTGTVTRTEGGSQVEKSP